MKSFQGLYTDFGTISENVATATTTFAKGMINTTQELVLAYGPWPFLEFTGTEDTVDGQNYYQLPSNLRKLTSLIVTSGTIDYRPRPVEDPTFWEYLQSLSTSESDVATHYYREGNLVRIYPTPASDGNTITMRGRKRWRDLVSADYTTGTIAAMTNGDETVTGTGTPVWTSLKPVAGKWLRPTPTSGDGDYHWYEISSITSITELELVKQYEGETFTGKTVAYSAGDFSIMPGEYHDLMLWRSLAIWFSTYSQKGGEQIRAERFWRMYDGGYEAGLEKKVGGLLGLMIKQEMEKVEGAFIDPSEKTADELGRFKIDSVGGEGW